MPLVFDRVTLEVKVRYSAGTYHASLWRARGSSTADALTAVERCVARYMAGTSKSRVSLDPARIPDDRLPPGHERWMFQIAPANLPGESDQ